MPTVDQQSMVPAALDEQAGQSQQPADGQSSKVVVGDFVVLSQNYSHSPAQRSLLAENIVKLVSFHWPLTGNWIHLLDPVPSAWRDDRLIGDVPPLPTPKRQRQMDQVFLATDFRRDYSRMEVTNIR